MGLLAEQIVIDCPPSMLEDLFCHRPATWIVPLLRLAGDEGEAAGLALLGEGGAADRRQSPRARVHRVELGQASRVDGNLRVPLSWQASDYRVFFGDFDGTIEVRGLGDHAVLSIEGTFAPRSCPSSDSLMALASRRAAETGTRSLLGHLRAAVEERLSARG